MVSVELSLIRSILVRHLFEYSIKTHNSSSLLKLISFNKIECHFKKKKKKAKTL